MENLRDYDDSDQEAQNIEEKEAMHDVESESNDTETKPIYNAFDSLTIELLSNKTQYKKYILSKENPEKYEEYIHYLKQCRKYQSAILNAARDLLYNPEDDKYDKESKYAFEVFAKTCFRYFDNLEEKKKYSFYEKDEDTLFVDMHNDNPIIPSVPTYSMWGKSIRKI